MEQSLGKRIAALRKEKGMTQDALAERLGLTAQAVSKWENDQSCPDITILPTLAEIFGVTTDELLGCKKETPPVYTAEVVTSDEDEDEAASHGSWSMQYESGRKGSLFFAALVLLVGALTLASRLLDWDASFWDILWPSALLIWGLNGIIPHFSVFNLGISLCGAYFLLENIGLWNQEISSEILFPVLILVFGVSLLIDALRKPKKPVFRVYHGGKRVHGIHADKKTVNDYSTDDDCFDCSLSFGENTRIIDLPRLSGGDISVSFGELTVDLSGCESISDGCAIDASCCFGQLNLLVPRQYHLKPDVSTAFGTVNTKGHPNSDPIAAISLDASVSFGEITIEYI